MATYTVVVRNQDGTEVLTANAVVPLTE